MKKAIFVLMFLTFVIIFVSVLVVVNYNSIRKLTPNIIKENLPSNILNFHENIMIPSQNILKSLRYKDFFYNVLFLPESHFAKFELKRFSISNDDENINDRIFSESGSRYFLDILDENILVTTYEGNTYYFKEDQLIDSNNITLSQIKNNLGEISPPISILDGLVENNKFYISGFQEFITEDGKSCKKVKLFEANFNLVNIEFQQIYKNDQCGYGKFMQAGRMKKYTLNDSDGLLFSLAENEIDKPNDNPQSNLSDFGKIIFLNLDTKKKSVFSKGHRNPQGLYVEGKTILSTEHGPEGGDEINKIVIGKNYGWPLASYGTYYNTNEKKYLKSHVKYGYEEPIFTYIPAIGISEIVKIPNEFLNEDDLDNIFFISSLNGKSLFLVKFGKNFEKIIFSEKIFIDQRIRDLKYVQKFNSFLLALEKPSQLAIIKKQ